MDYMTMNSDNANSMVTATYPSRESYAELLNELIKSYKSSDKNYTQTTNGQLKKHLHSIVFSHREDENSDCVSLSEFEKLVWHSHILRTQKKYDKAVKLEKCVHYFSNLGLFNDPGVQSVIHLLLCLSNNIDTNASHQFSFPLPWINTTEKAKLNLPYEPLAFNDTRLRSAFHQWHYTHFPSKIFHVKNPLINNQNGRRDWGREDLTVCHQEPGSSTQFQFLAKEDDLSKSCFGALIGPRKLKSPVTPDTVLSIPILPSVPKGYSIIHFQTVGKNEDVSSDQKRCNNGKETLTVDEGYVSSHCSLRGNSPTVKDEDIWETIAQEHSWVHKKRSWEAPGQSGVPQEKPFITESGNYIIRRLWFIEQQFISTFQPTAPVSLYNEITPEQLCEDVIYLLAGIPSAHFWISEETGNFEILDGVCFSGVTPESLRFHLRELAECGSKVLRTEKFCKVDCEQDSLAMSSLKRSIAAFLSRYRQKLFQLSGETRFLSLKLKTEALRWKISFVSKLCCLRLETSDDRGCLSLLEVLKEEFVGDQANLYLLVSFFNAVLKPFLAFLEKWIYEGELCDPKNEFIVTCDAPALNSRDRVYWTRGYAISEAFLEVTHFLKDLLVQAFVCGKALNLLKLCASKNCIVIGSKLNHPEISVCCSAKQIAATRNRCQIYTSEMATYSKNSQVSLRNYDEIVRGREVNLIEAASETHSKFIKKFNDDKKLRKEEITKKKKELFDNLKKNIEESKLAKEKIREEMEKEEQTIILQQRIMEEEEKLKENRQRVALIGDYQTRISNLESIQTASENTLKTIPQNLTLISILREDKEKENSANGIPPHQERHLIDHSSIPKSSNSDLGYDCRMSVSSDGLQTPVDEVVATFNRKNKADTLEIYTDSCLINENVTQLSGDNDYAVETNDNCNSDNMTSVTNTRSTSSLLEDAINQNLTTEPTLLTSLIPGSHSSSNKTTNRPSNINRDLNSNEQNTQETTSNSTRIKDNYDAFMNNDTEPLSKNSLPAGKSMESGKKSNKLKLDSDTQTTNEPSSIWNCSIRKSKSESCSLRDVFSCKSNRVNNRMSLCELDEDDVPVLVDQVFKKFTPVIEDPKSLLDDYEIKECLASFSAHPVLPYSVFRGTMKDSKSGVFKPIVPSVLKNGIQLNQDVYGKKNASQGTDLPDANQLQFAPIYIEKGLLEHLAVQSRLVNEALLSHFLIERNLLDHFEIMKTFLLFCDATFARNLTRNLFHKFPHGCPLKFINPAELNAVLNEALSVSPYKCPLTTNLTFFVSNNSNDITYNLLEVIELRYGVQWPLNIILDDTVSNAYAVVSQFLANLYQVSWSIEDAYTHMNIINSCFVEAKRSPQFHEVLVYRFELQQFVGILLGYVFNQAIEGSWTSFQRNLRENVSSLDELYDCHWKFIREVTNKCFLSSKFGSLQELIDELRTEILLFKNLVLNHPWRVSSVSGHLETPAFPNIQRVVKNFRVVSFKLNKTLEKLLLYTQFNHIEDLVLQLNYNENFQKETVVM